MYTTPEMGLTAWDQATDPYDHTDLVNNWVAIDQHDHTSGKGTDLPREAIPLLGQENLEPCSVSTVQLCDFSVTQQKLAAPAVRSTNIFDSAVTNSKIAPNAVDTPQLATGAVTEPKLEEDSVSTEKLVDLAVTNAKLGTGAVSNPKLAPTSVSTDKLADNAVTTAKIGAGQVDQTRLGVDSVNDYHVQDRSLGPTSFAPVPCVYLNIDHEHVVGNNEFHVVQWDGGRYNNWNMWSFGDRSAATVQVHGLYLITAGVMWSEGGAAGGVSGRRARIRVNGTPVAGDGPMTTLKDDPGSGSAPYRVRHSMSTVINLTVGSRIDVLVQQTSGANQRIVPDGLLTHLTATWIAATP